MSSPTFVSLYSGAGGLDLGLMMAGFAPVFSNDIDRDATRTYEAALEAAAGDLPHLKEHEHRVTTGDIRTIESLPERGAADLVVGGPPCQGFSVAGRMDPDDPRSRHVVDFLGMVQRVQPKAFIMENVKALAVNRRWSSIINGLIERAETMGYATSLHVLNASHYGVPQARERMFLVGVLGGTSMDKPVPSTELAPPSVRDALEGLPAWGAEGNDDLCTARVTAARNPVLRRSPWAGMLFNGQGRPMNLNAPAPTLPASMGGNRTPIIDQVQVDAGGDSWVETYHAALWQGGEVVADIPKHLRRITVQEAAAIQTFPPYMPWRGTQSARYRQIGNAVPPLLGHAVGLHLRKHLGFDDFDSPKSVLGLSIPVVAKEA